MITVDSPIVGKGGTVDEAMLHVSVPHKYEAPIEEYVTELHRLCELVGFDFRILFAQAYHETDVFSSTWWVNRFNPAGIGVTGDPAQNNASPTFANGTDAARAHVVHMCFYVVGQIAPPIAAYLPLDPRWEAVVDAELEGTVHKLGDLGNGKWAADPNYSTQIAAKANRIFQESPDPVITPPVIPKETNTVTAASVTFGLVPKPAVVNKHLDTSNPWISLSPVDRQIEAVVWHRMWGNLNGTDDWFRNEHAATAYGIGVAATDGTGLAGTIYEWIDPTTRYYGESSGPVSNAYGDGLALVNLVGVQQVNLRSEAIEISGYYDTPLDDASRDAIVNLTAWFADQKKIPWDQFPIVPGTTRSFVVWHREITIGTGKICPGQVVMDETPDLISAIAERLKTYQGGTGPKPTPKPEPKIPSVPWDRGAVGHQRIGTVPALAYVGEVTARKDAPVRAAASAKKGVAVIQTIQAGKTGTVIGGFISGGKRWYAIDCGEKGIGRAVASDFHEKYPMP